MFFVRTLVRSFFNPFSVFILGLTLKRMGGVSGC